MASHIEGAHAHEEQSQPQDSPDQYQREPVLCRMGLVFEGGFMKRTWAPPLSTMMKVEGRDDAAATYYTIDKGDRSFATMLGLDMSVCENVPIISYLVDRRNAATEEAMAKVVIEDEDPNAAEQGAPMDIASIKGKKQLMCDIPKELTIHIPEFGQTPAHSLNVLPSSWKGSRRGVQVECVRLWETAMYNTRSRNTVS